MTAIDLVIKGSPSEIFQLAEWLKSRVSVNLNELHDRLDATQRTSGAFWLGRTGDAFRDSAKAVSKGVDPVDVFASDAAEVIRAYARRLERGREQFEGYRESARSTALLVSEDSIELPFPPKTYILAPGQLPPIEYGPNGESLVPLTGEAYEKAKRLFGEIAEGVGTWRGELDNWISEHIVPLMARKTDFDPLEEAYNTLKVGNEAVRGFPLALGAAVWAENLKHLEKSAKHFKREASTHNERARSGNKAVKAAAEKVTKAELTRAVGLLDDSIGKLKIGTKIVLPGSGLVIDVVAAAADISQGGSPSSAGASVVGGVAGGGVGGIAAGTAIGATFPPVLIGAGIAGLAMLGSWGVKSLWENNLDLDVREAIDAGDFGYAFK